MSEPTSTVDHLIIGGGVAADKAARAARERAPEASVLILSADEDGPVYRPALTKDLWHGEDHDVASQDLHTAEETGAELRTGTRVVRLDPAAHTVTTEAGESVRYGTALLATGAVARSFPGTEDARVLTLRSPADYRRLREAVREGARVAVVGGGYLGPEIAAGLSRTGAEVTLLHSGQALLGAMFPPSITAHLESVFAEHGIRTEGGFRLAAIEAGEELTLTAQDGRTQSADLVVLGLGAVLATDLAREAGLDMDGDAVVVDEHLRTSAADLYAAGDIARFHDPLFGDRHVDHVDNAWASGETAGRNLTGAEEVYAYTPLFYSDLFDDGYEAVGRLDATLEMVELWDADHGAAVVHYLDGDTVVGVLLWNTWDSVPAARQVIADSQAGTLGREDLAARITPGG